MTDQIPNKIIPIDLLADHPMNYNEHPVGQVANLRLSIRKFEGQIRSMVVQDDGAGGYLIVAGHGFTEAARMEGITEIKADVIPAHWPPAKVLAYLAADNELARESRVNEDKHKAVVNIVGDEADDMFARLAAGSEERLQEMLEQAAEEAAALVGKGSHLALVDVTIADPFHVVNRGDVWGMGKHKLVCLDVFEDHQLWSTLLGENMVFAPFPGPLVPFVERRNGESLVMVQPDLYIAGHILDRYDEVVGEGAATLEENLLK